ncbi:hypothetical protein ACO0RG_001147 [Hanseniaspora osmophila]
MSLIDTQNVKIDKYQLFLDINPVKTNFNGSATIFFKTPLNGQELGSIKLYVDDLILIDYKINNSDSYNDSELDITNHTTTLPLHDHCEISKITINYIGKISTISTFKDKTYGIFKTNIMNESGNANNIVISTHCQPNFASKIFPCLLNSKSKIQLTIKTLSKFKVVSNTGVLQSQLLESSDERMVTFKETPYIQHAVFGFTLGDLDHIQTTVTATTSSGESKKILITVYSPISIQDCSFALDIIAKYFAKLNNEVFKKNPYPLDKLDFVALPFLSDYAMENHGMVSIQMNQLVLPKLVKNSAEYQQMEQLLCHELVHLWMGNYISFHWEHLWFNEAFATYMANHIIPNSFQSDDYLTNYHATCLNFTTQNTNQKTIANGIPTHITFNSTTDQLFNPQNYVKGIPVIRALVEMCGFDKFIQSLSQFFTNYEEVIDPKEIFEKNGIADSYDWFVSQWKECPVISVSKESSTNVENSPVYKIKGISENDAFPVFLNGGVTLKAKDLMLESNRAVLGKTFLFNEQGHGLYRVKYEGHGAIQNLLNNLPKIAEFDFYAILQDLQHFINTGTNINKYDISLPIEILTRMVSSQEIFVTLKNHDNNKNYTRAICMILEILEKIQLSVVKYGSGNATEPILGVDIYNNVLKPLFEIVKPQLFDTEMMEFLLEDVSEQEWSILSHLIFLLKTDEQVYEFSGAVIKSILSGRPIKSKIPMEIVGSCMASYSYGVDNVKDWKKIFNMVKNCEPYMHHLDYNSMDFQSVKEASFYMQNAITQNIGFVISPSIVSKLLNFIYTNIESTSIELLLFGVVFNQKQPDLKKLVWEWYQTNFDNIAQRSLRKGSKDAAEMLKTLQNISLLVFSMFLIEDSSKIDQFIILKHSKFNQDLQLDKIWALVKEREMHYIMLYQLLLQVKYDL